MIAVDATTPVEEGVVAPASVEVKEVKEEPKKSEEKKEVPKGLVVEEYRPYNRITPLQFLNQSLFTFGEKVHLSHLPYHPEGRLLVADAVTNVNEGKKLQAFNVSMAEIKNSVRKSILSGQAVELACEMRNADRTKFLLSESNDLTTTIFGMDTSIALSKGDELLYQVTTVAHGMVLIGCDDDPSAVSAAAADSDTTTAPPLLLPLGPLWKVENSWKDVQYLYLTDKWFDNNCYDVVVDRKFVSETVLAQLDAAVAAGDHILLPTGDPFCKI